MRPTKLIAAIALLCMTVSASAQTWPARPIRAIIPFGAGSTVDVIPRIVFEQMSAQLGQSIVVENRAGGGGTVGTAQAARSDADGYTILVHTSGHTIAPALFRSLPYDVVRDFAAVGAIGTVSNVLTVSPSGFDTVQALVAAAKAKPGSLSFASVGIGSAVHLSAERFRLSAGFDAVHVPFKGGPEAQNEVLAGRIDYYFQPITTSLSQIKAGNLRALAVSSPKRSSLLPDVPTTLEAGYPDSDYTFWMGIFVPAKTPADVIARLHDALTKALASPQVAQRLTELGVDPMPLTPAQFDQQIAKEVEVYAAFAKAANIQPN